MGITEKLIIVQSELKAPKAQVNDFGKYRYRSCEDIIEAVKPLLRKNDLVLMMEDDIVVVGERYYIRATARLLDSSGESIQTQAFAREPLSLKGQSDPQITGTASSYARKYALNGLFAIDDSKLDEICDPDGMDNYAKAKRQKQAYQKNVQKKKRFDPEAIPMKVEKATQEQLKKYHDLTTFLGSDPKEILQWVNGRMQKNYKFINEIPKKQMDELIGSLEKKAKNNAADQPA